MVGHDEPTKDWLAARVPSLAAWEGSRLKVVGMDALPTYKRVVALLRMRRGTCYGSAS